MFPLNRWCIDCLHRFLADDISAAPTSNPLNSVRCTYFYPMIQALDPVANYSWHMASPTKAKPPN